MSDEVFDEAARLPPEGGPLFGLQFSGVTLLRDSRTFEVVVEGTVGDAEVALTGEWLAPGTAMAAGAGFTHQFTFGVDLPPAEDRFEFTEIRVESDIVEGDYILRIAGVLNGATIEQTSEVDDATPADLFAAIDDFLDLAAAGGDLL